MANQKTALSKVDSFKSLINTQAMVKRMTTALGSKDKAGQFMASMLDLYESDKLLQNCDAEKVVMECLKAASLNLPLVKSIGMAYVVPYGSAPTFIVGYKGLIQLALRSGQYKALNADCIYDGEEITSNRMTGLIQITGAPRSDKVIGYFAYFQLTNGFEKALYMTVEALQAYGRKYSKAYSSGPWQTNFDEMAKKTLLRRILKYGPMSTEMAAAEQAEVKAAEVAAQATIDRGANRGAVIDVDVEPVPEPPAPPSVTVDPDTAEVISIADDSAPLPWDIPDVPEY